MGDPDETTRLSRFHHHDISNTRVRRINPWFSGCHRSSRVDYKTPTKLWTDLSWMEDLDLRATSRITNRSATAGWS
jgi:hypothetical protein